MTNNCMKSEENMTAKEVAQEMARKSPSERKRELAQIWIRLLVEDYLAKSPEYESMYHEAESMLEWLKKCKADMGFGRLDRIYISIFAKRYFEFHDMLIRKAPKDVLDIQIQLLGKSLKRIKTFPLRF